MLIGLHLVIMLVVQKVVRLINSDAAENNSAAFCEGIWIF